MKRITLFCFVLLLSVSLFGCQTKTAPQTSPAVTASPQNSAQPTESDENAVSGLVEAFGKKLKMVSLLAPADTLKKSIEKNYGPYITQALLDQWLKAPSSAPGRQVSSPWPDHIEISDLTYNTAKNTYTVQGDIIEITSVEQTGGGAAAKRPVTLEVVKSGNAWKIASVTLGAYEKNDAVVYENTQYGFTFSLPESWKGYKILTDKWKGYGANNGDKVVQTGPEVFIRHPQWTSENPRQDIPILIYTLSQWNALQKDQFNMGATPIGPRELGRNSKYVFALPARYNFAFLTGYQEVDDIINSNALHPTEKFK